MERCDTCSKPNAEPRLIGHPGELHLLCRECNEMLQSREWRKAYADQTASPGSHKCRKKVNLPLSA